MINSSNYAPYAERYYRVMKYFGVYFSFALVGYAVIIGFIPEEFSCMLENKYWFLILWPPNVINRAILESNSVNLDACRVIPANAWSAGMGILMLIDRIIFEINYNEKRKIFSVGVPIFLMLIAINNILPQSPLNPAVLENRSSMFVISTSSFSFISEAKLFIFSFFTFFLLSESFAYLLIELRSKLDSWR